MIDNYHFKKDKKATRDEITGKLKGKEIILVEEKNIPVNITLFHPHIHQLTVLNGIENGDEKFHTLVCSRRWGKSSLAKNLCLKWALSKNKEYIGYITSGLRLGRRFYNEILDSFPPDLAKMTIKKTNKSDLIIEFVNGSILQFFSFENPEKLRGQTLSKSVLDEAELLNDEDFFGVINPIFSNCEKVLLLGTPLDASGFYYNFFNRGSNNAEEDKRYKSYHYDIESIPDFLINKEEKEDIKKNTPTTIYDMEWKAIFSSSNISVFGNFTLCISDKEVIDYQPNYTYYGGIDVAKQGDYLVYTILRNDGVMVYQLRINRVDYYPMAHAILKVIEKYNVSITYIEVNNQGDAFLAILKEEQKKKPQIKNHKWNAVYTNNITKQSYVEDLIIAFQEKYIKILNNKELRSELGKFVLKITDKARVRTYSALRGHDDCVISLCLAYLALNENKNSKDREYLRIIKK
jgi:hypothetical protein